MQYLTYDCHRQLTNTANIAKILSSIVEYSKIMSNTANNSQMLSYTAKIQQLIFSSKCRKSHFYVRLMFISQYIALMLSLGNFEKTKL